MSSQQKKDVKPEDVLSTQYGDGPTPTPADDSLKNINALDAKQHNNGAVCTPQAIDEVAPDAERSNDNTHNTGPLFSGETKLTTPQILEESTIIS
jgi:hypothetical protein